MTEQRILDIIKAHTAVLLNRDPWLTLSECAKETKYSRRTLYRHVMERTLKATDVAGIRVRRSDLDKFMENHPYRRTQ